MTSHPHQTPQNRSFQPLTVWICVLIIVLGVVVGVNYVRMLQERDLSPNAPPPKMKQVEKDMMFTERSGEEVRLDNLRGRNLLMAYIFTSCPRECIGILAELRAIDDAFEGDEKPWIVAVSLDPDVDSPGTLQSWARGHNVDRENWWFLTHDDAETLRNFMSQEVGFFRPERITDPEIIAEQGVWSHDPRVFLIDGEAYVRGTYALLDPEWGGEAMRKLKRDLRFLIDN